MVLDFLFFGKYRPHVFHVFQRILLQRTFLRFDRSVIFLIKSEMCLIGFLNARSTAHKNRIVFNGLLHVNYQYLVDCLSFEKGL